MLMNMFKQKKQNYSDRDIVAPGTGRLFPVTQVSDEVFSKELMGQTIAFALDDPYVVAPANGTLEVLFPTGHAFAVRMKDGTGILVHIGVDTVNLNGKEFQVLVKQGTAICAGERIVKVDWDMIRKSGYDASTMLVVTENPGTEKLHFIAEGIVNAGEIINRQ